MSNAITPAALANQAANADRVAEVAYQNYLQATKVALLWHLAAKGSITPEEMLRARQDETVKAVIGRYTRHLATEVVDADGETETVEWPSGQPLPCD